MSRLLTLFVLALLCVPSLSVAAENPDRLNLYLGTQMPIGTQSYLVGASIVQPPDGTVSGYGFASTLTIPSRDISLIVGWSFTHTTIHSIATSAYYDQKARLAIHQFSVGARFYF